MGWPVREDQGGLHFVLANTLCDFGGLKRWEGRSGALIRALSHCLVWWSTGALPGGALRRWLGAQCGAVPAWRLVVLVSASPQLCPGALCSHREAGGAPLGWQQGQEGTWQHMKPHLQSSKAQLITSRPWSLTWHAQLGSILRSPAASSASCSGISALFVNQLNLWILI